MIGTVSEFESVDGRVLGEGLPAEEVTTEGEDAAVCC